MSSRIQQIHDAKNNLEKARRELLAARAEFDRACKPKQLTVSALRELLQTVEELGGGEFLVNFVDGDNYGHDAYDLQIKDGFVTLTVE